MQPSEIRIGNLVSLPRAGNKECVVEIIHPQWVHLHGNFIHNAWDDISGVPMTEEKLIEFGFTKCTDNLYYHVDIINSQSFFNGNDIDVYATRPYNVQIRIGDGFIKNVEFVHEFQNIMYSLFGVELSF